MQSVNSLFNTSPDRVIDRILMVTPNIADTLSNPDNVLNVSMEPFFVESSTTVPDRLFRGEKAHFVQYRANIPFGPQLELSIVQPVQGESAYSVYLEKYGRGIMGMREIVSNDKWEKWQAYIKAHSIDVIESVGDSEMTLDLHQEFGCFVQLVREEAASKASQTL